MLTAILPVRTEHNSFWNSSEGMGCIESFMDDVVQISDVDRFVVVSRDDLVCQLASQRGMEISKADIQGKSDRPYTFEQTRSLARKHKRLCINSGDTLLIADHRNLFLSADDIYRAISVYHQTGGNGVISLTLCKDYLCQLKAFFIFLGCVIIHFNDFSHKNEISGNLKIEPPGEFAWEAKSSAEIEIRVSNRNRCCFISFYSERFPAENFIAQILPFDQKGPLYEKSIEIQVITPEYECQLGIDPSRIKGVFFNLTMQVQSGDYDTLELFTPENAPWELGESISTVYSKKNHEPMYGRGQFPPAYTYDGSLCILSAKHLPDSEVFNPFLLVLKDSCITTSWADYWYSVISR